MTTLAALLLLSAPADAAADRALLAAFERPCRHVEDFARMQAEAPRTGWQPVEEAAAPRAAALMAKGREQIRADEKLVEGLFQRTHQGRAVYLILTNVRMESGLWANGCRVYDFDAAAPIDLATVKAWIGKEPTAVQDLGGGLVKHLWEPWVSGRTFEANYVPADNPMGQAWGLSGIVLVSGAIGGF